MHKNILEEAASWRAKGRDVAIATVVKTWGSSLRPVGSQLVVDTANNMIDPYPADALKVQWFTKR